MSRLIKDQVGDYVYDDGEGGKLSIQHSRVGSSEGQVPITQSGTSYCWIKPDDVEAVCDAIREMSARTLPGVPRPEPDLNSHTFYHPDDVLVVRTAADGPVVAYGVRSSK